MDEEEMQIRAQSVKNHFQADKFELPDFEAVTQWIAQNKGTRGENVAEEAPLDESTRTHVPTILCGLFLRGILDFTVIGDSPEEFIVDWGPGGLWSVSHKGHDWLAGGATLVDLPMPDYERRPEEWEARN